MKDARPAKSAKRQARELALQALYAWQLSGADPLDEARSMERYEKSEFLDGLLAGVRGRAAELEQVIAPHLDRDFARLSPIERAILYIGAFELAEHPRTPFKVVLNEAIELGKSFGAAEGYRFVNGVLEKIATSLRPDEVARSRGKIA
jgi:N utilization substance protein B